MKLRSDEEPPLIQSLEDLISLMEDLQATVQITYRVASEPAYLVRISRYRRKKDPSKQVYRQATGETLSEAFEGALTAWYLDEEAPNAGRRKGTEV